MGIIEGVLEKGIILKSIEGVLGLQKRGKPKDIQKGV